MLPLSPARRLTGSAEPLLRFFLTPTTALVIYRRLVSVGGSADMAAMIVAACEERPSPKAILVVADGYTGWLPKPVGPRVVACLTQVGTADSVPKWIDSVVLNPPD